MKKLLKVLLVLMTVVSIAGCSSKTTTEKATKKTKTLSGNYQVEIKVKDYGTIYAEIDADTAPVATIREDNRFVEYCRDCLPLGVFMIIAPSSSIK